MYNKVQCTFGRLHHHQHSHRNWFFFSCVHRLSLLQTRSFVVRIICAIFSYSNSSSSMSTIHWLICITYYWTAEDCALSVQCVPGPAYCEVGIVQWRCWSVLKKIVDILLVHFHFGTKLLPCMFVQPIAATAAGKIIPSPPLSYGIIY